MTTIDSETLLKKAAGSSITVTTTLSSNFGTSSVITTMVNISGSLSGMEPRNLTTSLTPLANVCISPHKKTYGSYFGINLAVPEWEALLTVVFLSAIILLTIVGNILVILSVFTYKPLRIVQNFFIVSLAVADLTVALLVLPFNVAYSILGRWEFGIHLCKMWLTCDVLCCTSSILNLCAIALDRYWAITDPINYAKKRTVGRVLFLISGVWLLSLLISSPPLAGWNDWPDQFTNATPCELTSNRGYVIYSSLGSFFIPLVIMTSVYIKIYVATRRRLRERAQASKINTITMNPSETEIAFDGVSSNQNRCILISLCTGIFCCNKDIFNPTDNMVQNDNNSFSSETQINTDTEKHEKQRDIFAVKRKKTRRAKIKDSIKCKRNSPNKHLQSKAQINPLQFKDSVKRERVSMALNITTNYEIFSDSENNQKNSEVCTKFKGAVVGDDNDSLKVTPMQTRSDPSISSRIPQKKPSGLYQFIEERQKISLSKERRAARTLGIIMGVFVICWLPFFLMYVILPFCERCCPTIKFKNFITWLGYINSGLNPIIYTIFNLDYRRAFKRLLHIK